MTLALGMITVDTTDAERLAGWWVQQLGGTITETNGGWYVVVKLDSPPVFLSFQKVDDPTAGKNRLHLDLVSDDIDAEVDRLLGAGATLVERRGDATFRWVTLADPDGNQFCVGDPHEAAAV